MDDLLLFFRDCGWKWKEAGLIEVVSTLRGQGVVDSMSLVGLDINDVVGAERWPKKVRDFVAELGTLHGKGLGRHPAVRRPQVLPTAGPVEKSSFAGLARDLFSDVPTRITNFAGVGPRAASQELKRQMPADPVARAAWRKKAKIAAVMGSCPDSHDSFKSGLRHWFNHIEITHGPEVVDEVAYPPQLEDILGWSNAFRRAVAGKFACLCECALPVARCLKTFTNYLGYVRTSCYAVGCDAPPAGHPAICRAMIAIAKRGLSSSRPRHFICRSVVHNMVLGVDKQLEELRFAMLWLIAYLFLLRVPSEVVLSHM